MTWEAVADTVRRWGAEGGIAGAWTDPTDEQIAEVARELTWEIPIRIAERTLKWLEDDENPARFEGWAVELAVSFVREGMAADRAIWLLYEMGSPVAEEALLRLGSDAAVHFPEHRERALSRGQVLRDRRTRSGRSG